MENYQVDKIALYESQEKRALERLAIIEDLPYKTGLAFVKDLTSFKKLRDCKSDIDLPTLINLTFGKISLLAGIKEPIADMHKEDILNFLFIKNGDLSIEEIWMAFELERHGGYPEKTIHFQVFGTVYVSSVLIKYRTWKQEIKITHNLPTSTPKPQPTISDDAKEQIVKDGVIRRYENFGLSGTIDEPSAFIFDYLYEKKLFPEDTPYEAIFNLAKRDLESEMKNNPSINKTERLSIKEEISALGNEGNEKVLARSKKMALEYLFKWLIEKKVSIVEFLN